MSDFNLMHILWLLITISCLFSMSLMLYVYKSMEQSLSALSVLLHEVIVFNHRRENETGISGMAKDTKVGQ